MLGSDSVIVASASSGVTITATDGSRSVTSNSFRVTNAPTPTPTLTPIITPSPTHTSTPTSTSKPTTTNGPTPHHPAPVPSEMTLKTLMATANDGSSVYIHIRGNVIDSNISNVYIEVRSNRLKDNFKLDFNRAKRNLQFLQHYYSQSRSSLWKHTNSVRQQYGCRI